MDKPDPLADCGEQDEAEEAAGGVVVSGRDAAAVLEPVDELLDAGTQGVEGAIDGMLHATVLLRGNFGCAAAAADVVADGVTVVASVGEQHVGINVVLVHQLGIGGAIMGLAGGQQDAERKSLSVGPKVDFAREPAARTAKSLVLSPPLLRPRSGAPGQWCCRSSAGHRRLRPR